jgi:hypothetical protein
MRGETRQAAERKVLGLHVRAGYNESNDLYGHRFRRPIKAAASGLVVL